MRYRHIWSAFHVALYIFSMLVCLLLLVSKLWWTANILQVQREGGHSKSLERACGEVHRL